MNKKLDYGLVFGLPGVFVLGSLLSYLALLGVGRELAQDAVTVALPIGAVALLSGIREARRRTSSSAKVLSLDLGGLLGILLVVIALALRTISLASDSGPLFYFTLACSSVFAYVAYQLAQRIARLEHQSSDTRAS